MPCTLYRNHTASKKDATQIIMEMGVDHALPGVGQGSVGFSRVGPGMGVPGRKGEEAVATSQASCVWDDTNT